MSNSTRCSFPGNIYLPCDSDGGQTKDSSSLSIIFASKIVIVALSPVAVVGNSLILVAIWKKTSEKTPFNILLSALALTDLFNGLVSQPFVGLPYLLFHFNFSALIGGTALLRILPAIGFSSAVYFCGCTLCILTFMSVERWLHMTRRSRMTTRRRWIAVTVLLLIQTPLAALAAVDVLKSREGHEVNTTIAVLMLLCFLITCFAYFKVFQVLRQHQQQVQANQSSRNVGRTAINLAKYKRTVVTILYILALFAISILPMVVSLAVIVYKGITFQASAAYSVCLMLLFSSSSLNPFLYLWRMNEIRNGVKQVLCRSG